MSSRNFIVAGVLASTLLFGTQFNFTVASALTSNTKIRINLDTNITLNVRRTPGGEKLGTQQGQSIGCVEETQGDWAKINYDQKEDGLPAQAGWSASRYLTAIGTCDNQPTTPTNRIKVNILPNTTLTVRLSPAGDRVGTQPNGAEGTKVGEPRQASGRLWQNVDFDPPAGGL